MAILSTTDPSPLPPGAGHDPGAATASPRTVGADELVCAAHELKAPAAAMLGLAELLATDPAAPPGTRQAAHLQHLMSAGRHLVALIDDLLDLSRAEAGRLPLVADTLDLDRLAHEAVALCNAAAGQPLASLERTGDPVLAVGDARRVRQVLANLLSNAVKFNRPGGRIVVGVGPGPCVVVSDDGAGLDAGQLERLFRPFDRLGHAAGIAPDGCGIGLALSRALTAAMDGTLTVSSTPGVGTTVRFGLPAASAAVPCPVPPSAESHDPLPTPPVARPAGRPPMPSGRADPASDACLLCIDDNPVTALMLQEHFRHRGGPWVRMAGNGRDGLALARAVRPRAVLLGLALPDLGGLQVLERLRDDPATRDLPVAIVAASIKGDEMRLARALGARTCWPKPLDLSRVDVLLAELLQQPATADG